jgi:hypothetical protein
MILKNFINELLAGAAIHITINPSILAKGGASRKSHLGTRQVQ